MWVIGWVPNYSQCWVAHIGGDWKFYLEYERRHAMRFGSKEVAEEKAFQLAVRWVHLGGQFSIAPYKVEAANA